MIKVLAMKLAKLVLIITLPISFTIVVFGGAILGCFQATYDFVVMFNELMDEL